MMPQRVQLRRTKGYRKPEGAVVVARPTKWGNPFSAHFFDRQTVVAEFKRRLSAAVDRPWSEPHDIEFRVMAESIDELRGRDLACWCPLGTPCHADVLMDLANSETMRVVGA